MYNLIDRNGGKRQINGMPLLLSIGSSLPIIPAFTFLTEDNPNNVTAVAGNNKTMSLGIDGYRYYDRCSAKPRLRWFGLARNLDAIKHMTDYKDG